MEEGLVILAIGLICLGFNIATEVSRDTGGGTSWYNRTNNSLTAAGAWILSVVAIVVGILKMIS